MKKSLKIYALLAVAALSVALWTGRASNAVANDQQMPHLDPEMTGREYSVLVKNGSLDPEDLEQFAPIVAMGTRNLAWIDHMNKFLDEEHKLSLSTAETQAAYPVEAPRLYNPTIIKKSFEDLKLELPAEIKKVLLEGAPFTQTPPIDTQVFLDWGRKVDRVYGIAVRWTTLEPYLSLLAARKSKDIRGYYFLSREDDLQMKLEHFHHLDAATQERLKPLLVNICENSQITTSSCESKVKTAISQQKVPDHYNKYIGVAKKTHDDYFIMPVGRDDVVWNSQNPNVMQVPFTDPKDNVVKKFLSDNIEDEWRLAANNWNLRLGFTLTATDAPFIIFLPNVTPNVNGLAGNQITMNASEPLTEYNVKWTIRHEFGHVLGFPDCYVEFYDTSIATMVNYQIDTTNLMCSRRGHIKDTHYNELKRVYYKN